MYVIWHHIRNLYDLKLEYEIMLSYSFFYFIYFNSIKKGLVPQKGLCLEMSFDFHGVNLMSFDITFASFRFALSQVQYI